MYELSVCLLLALVTSSLCDEGMSITSSDPLRINQPSDIPSSRMDNGSATPNFRSNRQPTIELQTNQGMILGRVEFSEAPTVPPTAGRQYYSFRGIPFAEAPIGDLRWKDPVDLVDNWPGGGLDATNHRAFCPQFDHDRKVVAGEEDCLYLNVYTPTLRDQDNVKLPVLVFIHGGAYTRGAAASHGPQKLMREDIVLVTMNYRLGVLGFLSTGDDTIGGNFGALDQVSALRWVRRNIASFGGDPEHVTLGGFSAGASFVHLHLLSPRSRGLFQKAIIMSGSANCGWSVHSEPWRVAQELASDLDCSSFSSHGLKNCLMSKSYDQLVKAQTDRAKFVYWPFDYRPVVDLDYRDEPFLPATVRELHDSGDVAQVPVLLGGTPEEGILFSLTLMMFSSNKGNAQALIEEDGRYIFESLWQNDTFSESLTDIFHSYYFKRGDYIDLNHVFEDLTAALTDILFTSCLWDAANDIAVSNGASVYTYLMVHREIRSPSLTRPMYNMAEEAGLTSSLLHSGVSHGDDMVLIFSYPYDIGQSSESDQQMSFYLTRTLATFITIGRPQLNTLEPTNPLLWKSITPGQRSSGFFKLSLNPIMMPRPFRIQERNLWQHTATMVEDMMHGKYSWFIATWVLFSILILALILVTLMCLIIYKSRRTMDYPNVGAPVLKRRNERNPSCVDT